MDQYYKTGAEVIDQRGHLIGHITRITGQSDDTKVVVKIADSENVLMFPYSVINHEESTEDRLTLMLDRDRFSDPMLGVGEHQTERIELAAEELVVHVNEVVRGRVLVKKVVETRSHREEVEVGEDTVSVERIASGDILDEPPAMRTDGNTMIVPVVEEVLVVEKRYRLIEEVHIVTNREIRTEVIEEELQRERVLVTEEDIDGNQRTLE